MEQYRKFTVDVIFTGITDLIINLEAFILLPIIIKFLGTSNYGIWSQLFGAVTILSIVSPFGLTNAMMRFFVSYSNLKDKSQNFYGILSFIITSSLIFSGIFFLLSSYIAQYFIKNLDYIYLVQLTALLILITSINDFVICYFNTFRQLKTRSLILISQSILELVIGFYFISSGNSLVYLLLTFVLVRTLFTLISLLLIYFQIGLSIPSFQNLENYLRFGIPFSFLIVFSWITHSIGTYIIGFYLTNDDVGAYSAVYTISKVLLFFIAPITYVLFPIISKAWDDKDYSSVRTYLNYSSKYFLLFAIPAAFGIISLGKTLLGLLANKLVSQYYYLFPLIILGIIVYKFGDFFYLIISCRHQTKLIAYASGGVAILNIILSLILIPKYGLLGAAITALISYLSYFVILNILVRDFKLDWNFSFIIKCIISSSIMAYVVRFIPIFGLKDTIIAILLGAAIYFVCLILLRAITSEEIKFFKTFIIR